MGESAERRAVPLSHPPSGRRGSAVPRTDTAGPRHHGTLASIKDSERRPLRPIGTSADVVAARIDKLLEDLMAIPSVQIFQGVHPLGSPKPPISHAVTAGRVLVFVESVAWPPGHYRIDDDDRVMCDGMYIGQSVGPLLAEVRDWRTRLPSNHDVSALVVVEQCASGDYTLPQGRDKDLSWAFASDAVPQLRERVTDPHVADSEQLLKALFEAIEPRSSSR
jgi:hypothetical protein